MINFYKKFIPLIIVLLIILSAFSSLIENSNPKISLLLISLGALIGSWQYWDGLRNKKESNQVFDSVSHILSKYGLGGVYTEMAKKELSKGITKKASFYFKKAISQNKNDKEAIKYHICLTTMALSYHYWLSEKKEKNTILLIR